MRRLITFLIKVGLLVGLAAYLASHPGAVSIDWQGWRIDTSIAVLLVALLIVIVVTALSYRFYRSIVSSPGRWRFGVAARRRERGQRALTLGMVAVAAGEAGEAARQSRKASSLLEPQPLTLMLAAQAAQLNGDELAARRLFAQMLDRPDTAFLGLRGLMTAALKAGDHGAALTYAERARALSPQAPWLLDTLFELQARTGAWAAAAVTATIAARRKARSGAEPERKLALAALGQAEQAEQAGQIDEAIRHARVAIAATPGAVPALSRLARLYLLAGRHGQAAKLIEQTWPAAAHPDLAALYGQAILESDPLNRVKRFQRLLQRAPDEAEGHLAVAEAATQARLWGEARRHYEIAATRDPATQSRAYRGLAEIEETETQDREKALDWRNRAAMAPPAPFWLCSNCDRPARTWSVRCLHCDAVGTLTWHQPIAGILAAIERGEPVDADVIEPEAIGDGDGEADRRLAALAHAAGHGPDDAKPDTPAASPR